MKAYFAVGVLACLLGYAYGAVLHKHQNQFPVDPGYSHHIIQAAKRVAEHRNASTAGRNAIRDVIKSTKALDAGTTCYSCSWDSNDEGIGYPESAEWCKDPFDVPQDVNVTDFIYTCSGKCMKERQKWTGKGETIDVIIRDCDYQCTAGSWIYEEDDYEVEVYSSCCTGDKCNTAVSTGSVSILVLALCLLLVKLFHQ